MSIVDSLHAVSAKLGVTAKKDTVVDQLNAMNDSIGAPHGLNAEDALLNYARFMGQSSPLDGVTVSALDDTVDLWGNVASDFQTGVTITGDRITGTLIKSTNSVMARDWGEGWFICLKFSNFPAGTDSCYAGIYPSQSSGAGDVYSDSDHAIIAKVNDRKQQRIKVTTTAGTKAITQWFDISGLEFTEAD